MPLFRGEERRHNILMLIVSCIYVIIWSRGYQSLRRFSGVKQHPVDWKELKYELSTVNVCTMFTGSISVFTLCLFVAVGGWTEDGGFFPTLSWTDTHTHSMPTLSLRGLTDWFDHSSHLRYDVINYLEKIRCTVDWPISQTDKVFQFLVSKIQCCVEVVDSVYARVFLVVFSYIPFILYVTVKLNQILANADVQTSCPSISTSTLGSDTNVLEDLHKDMRGNCEQKEAEYSFMSKTVNYLQERSATLSEDIKHKDNEIEELAKTIEYLQSTALEPTDIVPRSNSTVDNLLSAKGIDRIEASATKSLQCCDEDGRGETKSDEEMEWDILS